MTHVVHIVRTKFPLDCASWHSLQGAVAGRSTTMRVARGVTVLPLHRPLFSIRSRGKTRLVFRVVLLLLLVLGSLTLKLATGGWRHELSSETGAHVRHDEAMRGFGQQRRRLMEGDDDKDDCTAPADPPWLATFYIIGMLYDECPAAPTSRLSFVVTSSRFQPRVGSTLMLEERVVVLGVWIRILTA